MPNEPKSPILNLLFDITSYHKFLCADSQQKYSKAHLIHTANAQKNCANLSEHCELSEPILRYVFINGRELCPEHACELRRACELARVKLSGL